MASVYLEIIADWMWWFALLGIAAFVAFWILGTTFLGGKLIIAPYFFWVLAFIGFLARREEKEIVGV